MPTSTLASVPVRSSRKISARRRLSADRRLKAAVATVEKLETRQLLSTVNPFAGDPFPAVRSSGTSIGAADAVGDLNGDGIPDLVVVNEAVGFADSTVSIFIGQGDGHKGTGQFTYSEKLSTGLHSALGQAEYAVTIATLGNGHPDIIISNSSTYNVSIIEGNGHGGFSAPQIVQVAAPNQYVSSLTVGDVNGDSVPDLVVGTSGGVSVLLGLTGTDNFSPYQEYAVGIGTDPVVQVGLTDVNGDGLQDIVFLYDYNFPTPGGFLGYLPNTGNSTMDEPEAPFFGTTPRNLDAKTPGNGAYEVLSFAIGNLGTYGDNPDIVSVDAQGAGQNGVYVLAEGYNTGGYSFGVAESFSITVPSASGSTYDSKVNLGDLNGDGVPDVIITSYNASNGTAYINGFKTKSSFPYTVYTSPQYYTELLGFHNAFDVGTSFADLNGDGLVDLVDGYAVSGPHPYTKFYTNLNVTPSVATLSSATSTTFLLGDAANSFLVTTTGFPAPAISSPNLPAGLTLTDNLDGTATLSGSPNAGPGVYTFTLEAANSSGQDFVPFTLTVDAPPTAAGAGALTMVVGTAYNAPLFDATTGYPTIDTIVLATGTLPNGLSLIDTGSGTNQIGAIVGTPAPGTGGVYDLTFTIGNGILPNITESVVLTVNEAPAFSSPATAKFTVGTDGAFDISAQSGFPTAGETITLDGPDTTTLTSLGLALVDNMNGTAEIIGNPVSGSGGVYTLTLTATNTASLMATQTLVLTVDEAPSFSSASSTTFTDGVNGAFTVIADSGYPVAGTGITQVGLPAGLNLVDQGNGTAIISGTPAAGDSGVYAVTLTATNADDLSAMQTLDITVDQPPAFTSAAAVTFTVGTDQDFEITTVAFPSAGTLSEVGALPAGLTFTNNGDGTGSISGDPEVTTGGVYPIDLTFTNGISPEATQVLVLTVDEAPQFLTDAAATTFTVGTDGSYEIGTNPAGFPVANELITVDGADASLLASMGLTLTNHGDGIATITGTPPADSPLGPQTITLTASNGVSPNATQTLTITIDKAPSFTSYHFVRFTVGTDQTYDITANSGFPTAGETISDETPLPAGLVFTDTGDGTATISGTPAPGTGGFYEIDLVANNGVSPNATQTLELKVDELPAFTSAATYTFAVGVNSSFTITTTGHDSAALSSSALPSGLIFTDNGGGTGTISGIPAKTDKGTYGIVLTATNSTGTVHQSFELIVAPAKAPSITSAKTTTFQVGVAGAFNIAAKGAPSPSLTLTGGALPTGVTLVDEKDGTALLSGTPAAGTQGTYTYTLTAHNGIGKDATQTFTLIVSQPALFVSAAAHTFTAGIAGSYTVETTGILQAKLSVSGGLPPGIKFTDNGNGSGTFSGTPAVTSGGVYDITVTAANTTEKITQSFVLTVDQLPSLKGLSSAPTIDLTEGKNKTTKIALAGYPMPIAISNISGGPTGTLSLTVSGTNLILTGTPTETGLYTVSFTLTNGAGASDLSIILKIS